MKTAPNSARAVVFVQIVPKQMVAHAHIVIYAISVQVKETASVKAAVLVALV